MDWIKYFKRWPDPEIQNGSEEEEEVQLDGHGWVNATRKRTATVETNTLIWRQNDLFGDNVQGE